MKKLIIAAALIIATGPGRPAFAAMEYTFKDTVTFVLPFSNFSAAALYDFNGKESLLGGETTVIKFPKHTPLELTIGGVGDFSNHQDSALNNEEARQLLRGSPYLGFKYNIEALQVKDLFHVGAYYGRNWERGEDIYGVKANKKIWGR
jgi:hypothetical protein